MTAWAGLTVLNLPLNFCRLCGLLCRERSDPFLNVSRHYCIRFRFLFFLYRLLNDLGRRLWFYRGSREWRNGFFQNGVSGIWCYRWSIKWHITIFTFYCIRNNLFTASSVFLWGFVYCHAGFVYLWKKKINLIFYKPK